MNQKEDIASLENKLGYLFKNKELLFGALTHPSLSKKHAMASKVSPYERLEFLGDRVLGIIIAQRLYAAFPEDREGILAKKFATLVCQEMLSTIAHQIDLIRYMRKSDMTLSDATLSDACEALLGAIYLDGGLEAAFRVVDRLWGDAWAERDFTHIQDPKSRLQEWAQKHLGRQPLYGLVAKGGTDHDPIFTVSVTLMEKTTQGTGKTKRIAQQRAAEALFKELNHE